MVCMIVTEKNLKDIMDFFLEMAKLRDVKRRGWLVSGIKDAQDSAQHSFNFALMAMVLGEGRDLDVCKAIKMALVHDIAETRIGDVIVWEGYDMDVKEKLEKERKAMKDILAPLGEQGKNLLALWEEYEFGNTPEARFAREIDKLETTLQAFVYEHDSKESLNSLICTFYNDDEESAGGVKSKDLRKIVDEIFRLRKELGYDRKDRYPEPTGATPKDK